MLKYLRHIITGCITMIVLGAVLLTSPKKVEATSYYPFLYPFSMCQPLAGSGSYAGVASMNSFNVSNTSQYNYLNLACALPTNQSGIQANGAVIYGYENAYNTITAQVCSMGGTGGTTCSGAQTPSAAGQFGLTLSTTGYNTSEFNFIWITMGGYGSLSPTNQNLIYGYLQYLSAQ